MSANEPTLSDRSRYVRRQQLLGKLKPKDEPPDEIPDTEESRIVYDEPPQEWEPY